MTKTIHFKVSTELYYALVALKAQTHTDTWEDLMKHIVQTNNPQPKQPIQPEKKADLCSCGHIKEAHDETGCLANGGTCGCREFNKPILNFS